MNLLFAGNTRENIESAGSGVFRASWPNQSLVKLYKDIIPNIDKIVKSINCEESGAKSCLNGRAFQKSL